MIGRLFKRVTGVSLAAFLTGLTGGAFIVYALVMWVVLMIDPTHQHGAHFIASLVAGVILAGVADTLNERGNA